MPISASSGSKLLVRGNRRRFDVVFAALWLSWTGPRLTPVLLLALAFVVALALLAFALAFDIRHVDDVQDQIRLNHFFQRCAESGHQLVG